MFIFFDESLFPKNNKNAYISTNQVENVPKDKVYTYYKELKKNESDTINIHIIDVNEERNVASTSATIDNEESQQKFKQMQDEILSKNTPILERLLESSDYEMGFESLAEKFYNELFAKYGIIADTIMQNIYLKNMNSKNNYIIKHMLYIIAELSVDRRNAIIIIPLAGLSNPDIEIQDLSVRCIEKWGDSKYLDHLKKVKTMGVAWFDDYVTSVIENLEKGEN